LGLGQIVPKRARSSRLDLWPTADSYNLLLMQMRAYFSGRIVQERTGDGPKVISNGLRASVCNSASTFCESSFMYQVAPGNHVGELIIRNDLVRPVAARYARNSDKHQTLARVSPDCASVTSYRLPAYPVMSHFLDRSTMVILFLVERLTPNELY